MGVMKLRIVCGIVVLQETERVSRSAHLMSARSEERFWGRGRHQEWRATSLILDNSAAMATLTGWNAACQWELDPALTFTAVHYITASTAS
jgi:hypothetical protein